MYKTLKLILILIISLGASASATPPITVFDQKYGKHWKMETWGKVKSSISPEGKLIISYPDNRNWSGALIKNSTSKNFPMLSTKGIKKLHLIMEIDEIPTGHLQLALTALMVDHKILNTSYLPLTAMTLKKYYKDGILTLPISVFKGIEDFKVLRGVLIQQRKESAFSLKINSISLRDIDSNHKGKI